MPRVSLSEKDSPEAVQVLHYCPQEMQVSVCPEVEGVRKRTKACLSPLMPPTSSAGCSGLVCSSTVQDSPDGLSCLSLSSQTWGNSCVSWPCMLLCVHRNSPLPRVWEAQMCPQMQESWGAAKCLEMWDMPPCIGALSCSLPGNHWYFYVQGFGHSGNFGWAAVHVWCNCF